MPWVVGGIAEQTAHTEKKTQLKTAVLEERARVVRLVYLAVVPNTWFIKL